MPNPSRANYWSVRDRLNVTDEQWLVVKSILLILPYLVFGLAYFVFPLMTTTEFLLISLAYSIIAMYLGFPG